LGREFVEKEIFPLLNHKNYSIYDNFRTNYEHISFIIADELNKLKAQKVLLTDGGTYNTFLVERIQAQCSTRLIIPDKTLIDYKEALIFAFWGILRENKGINTLASVTGAKKDLSSGSV